jgi:hypothetical protein
MLNTIKRGLAAIACFFGCALVARGQQELSVSNTAVPYNSPAAIDINLSNSSPVSAVQFDLAVGAGGFLLPEVSDSIELSDRSDGHVAVLSRLSETVVRLLVYSNSNRDFKGSSGKLLTIRCRSTSLPGTYAASFSGTTVASATGQNLPHTTAPGTLTVQAPKLETSSTVALGNIPLLSAHNQSLWITNRGNQDLHIAQVTGSGGDLALSLPTLPQTLAPGSSVWFSYTVRPTVKGPFRHLLTIQSNDPEQPVKVVELTGTAYAVNTLSLPTNLQGSYLGKLAVPVNISNQEAFTGWQMTVQLPEDIVYVEGSARLAEGRKPADEVLAATVNGSALTLVAYSPSLQAFGSSSGPVATFELVLKKKGGRYTLPVSAAVIGNSKGEDILSGYSSGELSITAPELVVSPGAVDFGRITTRETAQRQVALSNSGSEDLRIDGIDLNGSAVTTGNAFPFTLAPGQSRAITLAFQSPTPVFMNTALAIRSNDPMGNRKVALTGSTYSRNELHLRNAAGFSNGIIRVPLYLENFDPLQGVQFDLQLPSGYAIDFADHPFRLSSGFGAFTVASNTAGAGTLRVVVYSLNGTVIARGTTILGEVLLKPASLLENYYGFLNISNVVLAGSAPVNLVSGFSGTSLGVCANGPSITSLYGNTFCDSTSLAPAAGQVVAWYRNDTLLSPAYTEPYFVRQPGTYNAIVYNSGCSYWTGDLVLTHSGLTKPVVSASGATTFCEGSNVLLTSSAVNGNQWYLNGNLINGATGNTYSTSIAGTYTVVVQENGCTSDPAQKVILTVLPRQQPRITSSGPLSICNGSSVVLTSSAATSYQWYRNWVLIPGATAQSYTATEPGYYYNVVTNTCDDGYDSVLVRVSSTPATLSTPVVQNSGETTFCPGSAVLLWTNLVQGVRYQWFKNDTLIAGASDTVYRATGSGVYTVRVHNVCNNDSLTSAGLNVRVLTVPDTLVITASGPTFFCNGGNVTLTASAANNYQWYDGTTPITGATGQSYTATHSGSFAVLVTNPCGNSTSNPILVTVSSTPLALTTPTVSRSGDTTLCPGNSVLFHTQKLEGVLYQWYLNGGALAGATDTSYTASASGTYSVRLYNACNNDSISSRSITVTVLSYPDTPQVNAGGPLSFCTGSTVKLTSSPQSNYQWYKDGTAIDGASGQSFTAAVPGSYQVYTTNTCGSKGSAPVAVTVIPIPGTPVIRLDTLKSELVSSNESGNQWYLDGDLINGANGQRLKPSQSGNYSVKTTVEGCASQMSTPFSYIVTGIVSVDGKKIFLVSPNPAGEKVSIAFSGQKSDFYDVVICDINGRIVRKIIKVRSGDSIKLDNLLAGIYVLKFSSPRDKLAYIVRVVKI